MKNVGNCLSKIFIQLYNKQNNLIIIDVKVFFCIILSVRYVEDNDININKFNNKHQNTKLNRKC